METHLTHIYAKLGIRSRTELARTLPLSKVQGFPRFLGGGGALASTVPSYLVETYLARARRRERAARERRAGRQPEQTRRGARRPLRPAIHVPEDEICFFVFDAARARSRARGAAGRLEPLRVVEAISTGRGEREGTARGRGRETRI